MPLSSNLNFLVPYSIIAFLYVTLMPEKDTIYRKFISNKNEIITFRVTRNWSSKGSPHFLYNKTKSSKSTMTKTSKSGLQMRILCDKHICLHDKVIILKKFFSLSILFILTEVCKLNSSCACNFCSFFVRQIFHVCENSVYISKFCCGFYRGEHCFMGRMLPLIMISWPDSFP